MAVRVPDFTGGDWKKLEKVTYFEWCWIFG
jgi:hypothetical protein